MAEDPAALRILVFTRTAGFRHASIPTGVATLRELASADGIAVDHIQGRDGK